MKAYFMCLIPWCSPILEDFKPELILNSAGQDNHYTDPLANMRFSAQGYAKLNEKLAPDMAVLEGGYAIQSALPYVNTGIILAMAGLDYSCVREPDFKPGMFVQAAGDRKTLEETVAAQLENWKKPGQACRSRGCKTWGLLYPEKTDLL